MYLYSSCDFLLQGDEVSAFLRCSHLAETQLTDRQTNHQKFTSLTCNDNAVRYNNNYIISHILTTKILTGKQNIWGAPKQCPRFLKVNKNKKGMVNAIKDLLYNIKVHKIQIVILYIKKKNLCSTTDFVLVGWKGHLSCLFCSSLNSGRFLVNHVVFCSFFCLIEK